MKKFATKNKFFLVTLVVLLILIAIVFLMFKDSINRFIFSMSLFAGFIFINILTLLDEDETVEPKVKKEK